MSIEVHMPKLGMTMREGTLVKWLKKEGEQVQKGEALAEITSEKITNTIEAPASGVLEKVLYPEGEVVEIGKVIAFLSEQVVEDTVSAAREEPVTETKESEDTADYEIRPLGPLRKVIGERMTESLRSVPQGTLTTRADMSGLIALKEEYAALGQKVTFTDLFIKTVSVALLDNPIINSSLRDGKVYTFKSAHIGVGVGTDEALFVPVIKNADKKGVVEISQELKQLSQKVKDGSIGMEEMSGGTFTISNLGMFDVDIITPVINPPESAILAIGATRQEVVVDKEGQMVIKPLTTLCLTADHTLVDGITAVEFLAKIKEVMRSPQIYLR